MPGDVFTIVGVGVRRVFECEFERLDAAYPYVSTTRIGEDSRPGPLDTYCIPRFIFKIVAHTLYIHYSNLVGSVPSFNIIKCELGQEIRSKSRRTSLSMGWGSLRHGATKQKGPFLNFFGKNEKGNDCFTPKSRRWTKLGLKGR